MPAWPSTTPRDRPGRSSQEGITEAGATATFTAAATSYATWGEALIPCYLLYSMFGFQRVGDLLWALGDSRGRGFLLGCTAGRTTLNGEGLQHQDGHSLLLASTYPSVQAYDPAFAYEVATIVEDGIRRMTGPEPEDRFWYLTLYNENYVMPPLPADPADAERVRAGTVAGMYRFADVPGRRRRRSAPRATVLFSGPAWRAALEARRLLADDWGVGAEAWSVTSYKALREEAIGVDRHNRLHPDDDPRVPFVTAALAGSAGPVVAVTDFMRAVPDQVARWVPRRFTSLGTDGFGRSDTREVLRRFFEVDAAHVVVAVLEGLAADGAVPAGAVSAAIGRYGIDAGVPRPLDGLSRRPAVRSRGPPDRRRAEADDAPGSLAVCSGSPVTPMRTHCCRPNPSPSSSAWSSTSRSRWSGPSRPPST